MDFFKKNPIHSFIVKTNTPPKNMKTQLPGKFIAVHSKRMGFLSQPQEWDEKQKIYKFDIGPKFYPRLIHNDGDVEDEEIISIAFVSEQGEKTRLSRVYNFGEVDMKEDLEWELKKSADENSVTSDNNEEEKSVEFDASIPDNSNSSSDFDQGEESGEFVPDSFKQFMQNIISDEVYFEDKEWRFEFELDRENADVLLKHVWLSPSKEEEKE